MRVPKAGGLLEDFGDLLKGEEAEEPILSPELTSAVTEWLTEIWQEKELLAAGLKPRRTAMFHGAPGTGKTTLGHHFAGRLGLPMLLVRPDRLIGAWLGHTTGQVGALFDAARAKPKGEGPVILFFDEFEAIARTRGRDGGGGAQNEMNRVVDVILQRLDAHDGYVIAATNEGSEIDPAIWRRFHMHIEFKTPGQAERVKILARYLKPWGLPARPLETLASLCETASPAIMRQLCEGLKRNLVIGEKLGWDMRKGATLQRVLAAIEPHPSLGKPELWTSGGLVKAVDALPWPLPLASTLPKKGAAPPPETIRHPLGVIPFHKGSKG